MLTQPDGYAPPHGQPSRRSTVGCGNGRQSFALAEHFPRVMGVDLSAEAIRGAQALYRRDNLEFRIVDILDDDEVAHLHDELGDANVYVRGVLHQLRTEDLAAAVRTVATLVGRRGRAFVVELSPAAEGLFKSLASDPNGPPPKLARVFQHGIVPVALAPGQVRELFMAEGLAAVFTGASGIVTTQVGPGGQPLEVPCDAWLFSRSA
ncbi:MAG: class I SAM-dependent methyltransferase [Acidimicrobiales bacterium]